MYVFRRQQKGGHRTPHSRHRCCLPACLPAQPFSRPATQKFRNDWLISTRALEATACTRPRATRIYHTYPPHRPGAFTHCTIQTRPPPPTPSPHRAGAFKQGPHSFSLPLHTVLEHSFIAPFKQIPPQLLPSPSLITPHPPPDGGGRKTTQRRAADHAAFGADSAAAAASEEASPAAGVAAGAAAAGAAAAGAFSGAGAAATGSLTGAAAAGAGAGAVASAAGGTVDDGAGTGAAGAASATGCY